MPEDIENSMNPIASLGAYSIATVRRLGSIAIFLAKACLYIFQPPFQVAKTVQQVYSIGASSVFLIAMVGTFTGMVLGLQGYYTLVKFGSEGLLGAAVALSVIRELGPVLTAIMITGRAGSAMAAELGIMRISEQIDALDTMDVNPLRYLVSPRVAAAIISFPLLTAVFDVIGIVGGYIAGVLLLGINSGIYFSRIHSSVGMTDVTGGFLKSLCFGVVVVTICCYEGFYTYQRGFGARGVSLATTSAVVTSCVLILVTDYVITSLLL